MNSKVKALFAEAKDLAEEDRILLADLIWDTLSEPVKDEIFEIDPMQDPEFRKEIERRIKDADEHPELLLDGEEMFKRLRERFLASQTVAAS